MNKIICICCLLLITWCQMEGQSLQISGSRVQLPTGDVLGAAFYEEKGMFFVQQSVSSAERAENGRLTTYSHRELSSWSLTSHDMITRRVIGGISSHDGVLDFCGRVQISTTTHHVYICSALSHVEILDPGTLESAGTMAPVDGQIIIDFAVDDLNGRALVLSVRKDKSIVLTSYSLATGERQQETALPDINREGIGVPPDLVSVSRSGQVGIYLDDKTGSLFKSNSGIYICKSTQNLACVKTDNSDLTTSVAQIAFLGQDILAATSKLADSKWACITSVTSDYRYSLRKPLWWGASRKYCLRNGVHYAVGVVEDKYVVGFTGVDKIDFLSGFDKPVSSSFSVWRAGTSKVAASVDIPTDNSFQRAFRIVASNTEPLFIAYHGMSNTLYLYSITAH